MAPTPEEEYLGKLEKIVKAAVKPDFDALKSGMKSDFDKVNTRFDKVEGRLGPIDTKLASMDDTLKLILKKLG